MSNNKTAVEQILQQVQNSTSSPETEYAVGYNLAIQTLGLILPVFLQIEKQQIIDAYEEGRNNECRYQTNLAESISGEEYYSKTYKTQTNES